MACSWFGRMGRLPVVLARCLRRWDMRGCILPVDGAGSTALSRGIATSFIT